MRLLDESRVKQLRVIRQLLGQSRFGYLFTVGGDPKVLADEALGAVLTLFRAILQKLRDSALNRGASFLEPEVLQYLEVLLYFLSLLILKEGNCFDLGGLLFV